MTWFLIIATAMTGCAYLAGLWVFVWPSHPGLAVLLLVLSAVGSYAWLRWWWIFARAYFPLQPNVQRSGLYDLAEPLPRALTEASGAVAGGRYYLVGGIGPWAQTYQDVFAYDPRAGKWSTTSAFPGGQISHAGVVGHAGSLYIAGGFGPLGLRPRGFMIARWNPLTAFWRYEPETDSYTTLAPLPAPRGAGGIAACDGAIWYVGGIDEARGLSAAFFRYDIATDSWERMPDMPTPRDHLRLEAVGQRLYAISGRRDDLRHNLDAMECYDIAAGEWRSCAPIPTARGGFGSTVHGGRIYVFGGEMTWHCCNQVECYDPLTDSWQVLEPLPEPRHGICAGVLDGRIHLISGGLKPRISVSNVHRTYEPQVEA